MPLLLRICMIPNAGIVQMTPEWLSVITRRVLKPLLRRGNTLLPDAGLCMSVRLHILSFSHNATTGGPFAGLAIPVVTLAEASPIVVMAQLLS